VIRFAARRLGFMLLILVVSSVVVFVVGRLAPGDPVQLLMGDLRDPATEARLRKDLGLDLPLWAQYLHFAGRALRGDLGQSYANPGRSINRMIADAVPPTARLALAYYYYPNAACSQQSILGMEIFKQKGYKFRKVSMFDSTEKVGHFAYEIYYGNGWHFFDTDQEPDANILRHYGRPSAAFLAENPSVVLAAYRKRGDPQLFKRLLINAKTGPVNKFPAPNAYLYQFVTKYFTYFGWLFFLSIIYVRKWVKKKAKNFSPVLSVAKKEEETVPVFS